MSPHLKKKKKNDKRTKRGIIRQSRNVWKPKFYIHIYIYIYINILYIDIYIIYIHVYTHTNMHQYIDGKYKFSLIASYNERNLFIEGNLTFLLKYYKWQILLKSQRKLKILQILKCQKENPHFHRVYPDVSKEENSKNTVYMQQVYRCHD